MGDSPINTTSVAASDALLRETRSVQQIASVVTALSQAKAAQDALEQIRQLNQLTDDYANEVSSEGLNSHPTLQRVLKLGLEALLPLQARVAMKSTRVSTESLEQVLSATEESREALQRQSNEATRALLIALNDAVPAVLERVSETLRQLKETQTLTIKQLQDANGLSRMLAVNGQIPEDLDDYYNRYLALGTALLGMYSEVAFAGAMRAAEMSQNLRVSDAEAFWASVGVETDAVGDPRKTLSAEQLELGLPGGGALFTSKQQALQEEHPIIRSIVEFSASQTPQDPTEVATLMQRNVQGEQSQVSAMIGLNRALDRLAAFLSNLTLTKYVDAMDAAWMSLDRGYRGVSDVLGAAPQVVKQDLGDAGKHLMRYYSTLESLVRWPLLHYCANLLISTNALVLLAQLAMSPDAVEITEPVLKEKEKIEESSEDETDDADDADDQESEETDTDEEEDSEDDEDQEDKDNADDASETPSDDAEDDSDKQD